MARWFIYGSTRRHGDVSWLEPQSPASATARGYTDPRVSVAVLRLRVQLPVKGRSLGIAGAVIESVEEAKVVKAFIHRHTADRIYSLGSKLPPRMQHFVENRFVVDPGCAKETLNLLVELFRCCVILLPREKEVAQLADDWIIELLLESGG